MGNQIIYFATISPANTPMEVSTNGGASFVPLAFTTVGNQQQGTLTGVMTATYAAGQLVQGAVGYPSTRATNSAPVFVLVDQTRFALSLKSYVGANTASTWLDLSGNGRNITQNAAITNPYLLTPNVVNGKAAYVGTAASTTAYWMTPSVSSATTDLTIYMAVRVDEVSNVYCALLPQTGGGNLYLGINSPDINGYYKGGVATGPLLAVAAGQVAIIVWRLNSTGVSIRRNGTILASGLPFSSVQYLNNGFLFNQSNNYQLRGAQLAYAVSVGNDTDAQVAQYEAELGRELGVTVTNLVWQENNVGITYSGTWTVGGQTSFYGTGYIETVQVGANFQFTVPVGYTALSMQGHKDSGGSYFTIKQNGAVVVKTDQYNGNPIVDEYFKAMPNNRLPVAAGDVIVFTRTNSNFTTDATGSVNVSCFADQITFHP